MHNIEINNGVASFVENGRKERAWHKLGQVFDGPMTVKEALELSHADYEVSLQPVFMVSPAIQKLIEEGADIPSDMLLDYVIPNRKATMRTDTNKYLGTVGSSYGIVQNADAFRFIDTLATGSIGDENKTPVIETAGVLGHGERVFVTAKFPEAIRLDNAGNDLVEMNMVFTTSHDGNGAVAVLVTPVRVVCNNTLNYALRKNEGRIYLKHTSGVNQRLDLTSQENVEYAYRTLNLFEIYKKSLEETFARLRGQKLYEKQIQDIIAEVALSDAAVKVYRATGKVDHEDIPTRSKNIYYEMMEAVHSGVGQDVGTRGTGLWLMNGITSYFQNSATYKSEEAKMDSILNGTVNMKVQDALHRVLEVA